MRVKNRQVRCYQIITNNIFLLLHNVSTCFFSYIAYIAQEYPCLLYTSKNLRAYPGVERGSAEWEETYKIRVNVEKSINHFKDSFCVANRKTQNEKTLHADLLLAGIAQLVTVIVADKIHQHQYIRSLKPLIA